MRLTLALSVVALLALAACGPSQPRGRVAPEEIAFVFSSPGGLTALDAGGVTLGPLVVLPSESEPSGVSLAADRQAVVFALTRVSKTTGFGSDVWYARLDGSEVRALVEHERDNVFYSAPLLDPSGQFVYVQRRAAVIKDGQYLGNEDSIERVDLRTKERRRLAEQAADPALSPDGKTLVYVRVVQSQPEGLWRVGIDGGGARAFFSLRDTWWWLQSPRFSPDGKTLVFSGAGHSAKSLVPAKLAHLGIPSDLFLAPIDGSSVKAVAQTGDDVAPAWSPDGTRLAFVQGGALWVVSVADGGTRQLARGDRFFFGDLVWVR